MRGEKMQGEAIAKEGGRKNGEGTQGKREKRLRGSLVPMLSPYCTHMTFDRTRIKKINSCTVKGHMHALGRRAWERG